MPFAERLARICLLLDDAFRAETFADHVVRVAVDREASGDAFTGDALRTIARSYHVQALRAWGDIACINEDRAPIRGSYT